MIAPVMIAPGTPGAQGTPGNVVARGRCPLGRGRRLLALAALVMVVGVTTVGLWPVSTRQGVNFEVSARRMPLYLKAMEFVDRSAEYSRIAERHHQRYRLRRRQGAWRSFDGPGSISSLCRRGFPVVDDHILNIIVRGYGQPDQQADVFATLTTYAGLPAFWQSMGKTAAGQGGGVPLTLVSISGRWVVFDVAEGAVFRNARGELATLDDLHNHPRAVPREVASLDMRGRTMTRIRLPAFLSHPFRNRSVQNYKCQR